MTRGATEFGTKEASVVIASVEPDNEQIHRRQFAIGPRPLILRPGWVGNQLAEGVHLSHCPELRIASVSDVEGNRWHLLGLAVQSAPGKPEPVAQLAEATPETIQGCYHHWAGRWILLGTGRLHLDACGLLACYYGFREPADGGREFWMSSSPAIMAELLGAEPRPEYPIKHGYGMDWYPSPGSGISGIRRLLPTQVLDISSGKTTPRKLVAWEPAMTGYEETLDALQISLVTALTNVSRLAKRLWLPLTGGKDSRTILAGLHHAGLSVKTYTHHREVMSHADRTFPQLLAKAVGREHTIFTGSEYRAELADLWDHHTAGHCVGIDRFYFSHQYFNWCRKGDIILRSHCLEIGRLGRTDFPVEEYGRELPEAAVILEQWKQKGFQYTGKDPAGFFPESMYKVVGEWTDWVKANPAEGIDWRDRFSIEQGFTGWLSSIEQSLDLIDAERFYAGNCHRFIGLALQVPEEKRPYYKPMHQYDLMRRMAPQLLKWPCNPPDPRPLLRRIKGKLGSLLKSRLMKRT